MACAMFSMTGSEFPSIRQNTLLSGGIISPTNRVNAMSTAAIHGVTGEYCVLRRMNTVPCAAAATRAASTLTTSMYQNMVSAQRPCISAWLPLLLISRIPHHKRLSKKSLNNPADPLLLCSVSNTVPMAGITVSGYFSERLTQLHHKPKISGIATILITLMHTVIGIPIFK